jgi:hypothetical protein
MTGVLENGREISRREILVAAFVTTISIALVALVIVRPDVAETILSAGVFLIFWLWVAAIGLLLILFCYRCVADTIEAIRNRKEIMARIHKIPRRDIYLLSSMFIVSAGLVVLTLVRPDIIQTALCIVAELCLLLCIAAIIAFPILITVWLVIGVVRVIKVVRQRICERQM